MRPDQAWVLADDLEKGFVEMVERYQRRIYAFSLSLSGNPAEAEEVAQDAFWRAYRALRAYPPQRRRELQVSAWLHRIALNAFLNRKRGRRQNLVQLDGQTPDASQPGPEIEALRAETLAELARAVAALAPRFRHAVVLRCVQDLPYSEIAEILDQPVGTVKSNVHRGLEILRRRLGAQT
jgi:RNA polymerase sigma-70 factor (ECF subfamily)